MLIKHMEAGQCKLPRAEYAANCGPYILCASFKGTRTFVYRVKLAALVFRYIKMKNLLDFDCCRISGGFPGGCGSFYCIKQAAH